MNTTPEAAYGTKQEGPFWRVRPRTADQGGKAERLTYPGAVRNRSYFYSGKPERGEQGLGSHKYTAQAHGLYDVGADPEHLGALAKHYNTTPFSAKYNQGIADPVSAANDTERLAKEYGYSGVLNKNTGMPMAAVFSPLSVTKAT